MRRTGSVEGVCGGMVVLVATRHALYCCGLIALATMRCCQLIIERDLSLFGPAHNLPLNCSMATFCLRSDVHRVDRAVVMPLTETERSPSLKQGGTTGTVTTASAVSGAAVWSTAARS